MKHPIEQTPSVRRYRPWLSVLLTILIPGLGQFYAGRSARAVVLFLLVVALTPATVALMMTVPSLAALAAMVLLTAVRLWTIVDAYLVAKREPLLPWNWKRRANLVAFASAGWVTSDIGSILTRASIAEPFHMPAGSMEPALMRGDYFMLDKRAYNGRSPEVGDVVVFGWPDDPEQDFVKRIIAGPGDRLSAGGDPNVLAINGTVTELAAGRRTYPSTLAVDQYFVVGDNVDNSIDSRMFGPVAFNAIHGKARFIHFSRWPDTWSVRWGRIGRRLDQP